jgi:hypothetical protein
VGCGDWGEEGLGERDRLKGGLTGRTGSEGEGPGSGSLGFVRFGRRDRLGLPGAWVCSVAHRDCLYFDVLGGMEWIIGWWSKRPKNRALHFHVLCKKKRLAVHL